MPQLAQHCACQLFDPALVVLLEDDSPHLLDGGVFLELLAGERADLEEHLCLPALQLAGEAVVLLLGLQFLDEAVRDLPVLLVDELAPLVDLVDADQVALEQDGAELLDGHCVPLAVLGDHVDQRFQFERVEVRGPPVGKDDLDDVDWQFLAVLIFLVLREDGDEGFFECVLALYHLLDDQQDDVVDV